MDLQVALGPIQLPRSGIYLPPLRVRDNYPLRALQASFVTRKGLSAKVTFSVSDSKVVFASGKDYGSSCGLKVSPSTRMNR